MYPGVGDAMVRLLERQGVRVDFPEVQTCCGQPAYNSGYWDDARAAARTVLDAFDDSDFVIAPSGSCVYMLHHYRELFRDDPQRLEQAKRLAAKTYEFSQFLVKVLGVRDVGAYFPHRVTYHPSCHGSRLLGVKDEPLELLSAVRGLTFAPLPYAEDCCGFGGTFAVKMADISGAMVAEKAEHVAETEAEVLTGLDMGCLMNIGGRLRRNGANIRVLHLAELLAEGVERA
jgi:L-lactate dehydrogenase complex protein LldE